MSRHYQMDFRIDVASLTEKEIEKVKEEIDDLWDIDCDGCNVNENGDLYAVGEGYLIGGEMEEEFCTRAAHQLWETLGRFMPIQIYATFLEQIPSEDFVFDEDNYKEFVS